MCSWAFILPGIYLFMGFCFVESRYSWLCCHSWNPHFLLLGCVAWLLIIPWNDSILCPGLVLWLHGFSWNLWPWVHILDSFYSWFRLAFCWIRNIFIPDLRFINELAYIQDSFLLLWIHKIIGFIALDVFLGLRLRKLLLIHGILFRGILLFLAMLPFIESTLFVVGMCSLASSHSLKWFYSMPWPGAMASWLLMESMTMGSYPGFILFMI